MGNLTVALVFVWTLNILMFMTQAAVVDLSANPQQFYNCSGSILKGYAIGDDCTSITLPDSNSLSNDLPISAKTVEEDSGFGFVDAISTAKNWVTDKIEYWKGVLSGPAIIINNIPGLPQAFKSIILLGWWSLSLFLLVTWIRTGGE